MPANIIDDHLSKVGRAIAARLTRHVGGDALASAFWLSNASLLLGAGISLWAAENRLLSMLRVPMVYDLGADLVGFGAFLVRRDLQRLAKPVLRIAALPDSERKASARPVPAAPAEVRIRAVGCAVIGTPLFALGAPVIPSVLLALAAIAVVLSALLTAVPPAVLRTRGGYRRLDTAMLRANAWLPDFMLRRSTRRPAGQKPPGKPTPSTQRVAAARVASPRTTAKTPVATAR